MVTAAATLPDNVLLELERLHVPNTYIHENPHFVGLGSTLSPGPQLLHGRGSVPVSPVVARVRGGNTGALTLPTAPEVQHAIFEASCGLRVFGDGPGAHGTRRPARGEGGSARCVVARMPAPAPRKRLSDTGRMHVLGLLADALETGQGMSVQVFVKEYCAVAKHAENWATNLRLKYGKLAELPAYARVLQYLRSGGARLEILACMRSGTTLHPGIEQCRALVAELEHLQAASAGPSGIRPR